MNDVTIAREYAIEVFTPNSGAGGTDKAPVLLWFNDIGVSLKQVKYSGENVRAAFERDSDGIGGVENNIPLEFAHLQLRLSNTGGNSAPSWRAGFVKIYWGEILEHTAEWDFNVDLAPGGPGTSRPPIRSRTVDVPKLTDTFFLKELPLTDDDIRDEEEIQRYLANYKSAN